MAHTAISNIIFNNSFANYVQRRSTELSALFQSGVVARDPTIASRCEQAGFGGKTVSLPFWGDLDGDDEVLSESNPLSVNNLDAKQDVAVVIRRGKAWGMNDLAADLAGDDPMRTLADRFASYWNRRHQKTLFSILKGVFASNVKSNNGDHVLDISGLDGNDAYLNKDTLLAAAQLLGDSKEKLTAIAMHSAAETVLSTEQNTTLYKPSETEGQLSRYNGRSIIVDDGCGYDPETGIAEIYLFGAGAVAYNPCPERVPYEVDRDSLHSREHIITRTAGIIHVRGVAWQNPTIADVTPSNTELESADAWMRVYDPKDVRCVKLICKL